MHEQESNEEREKEREVGGEGGEKRPRHSLYPLPRFVSLQERETLDVCLGRWREELEQDMAGEGGRRARGGGGTWDWCAVRGEGWRGDGEGNCN